MKNEQHCVRVLTVANKPTAMDFKSNTIRFKENNPFNDKKLVVDGTGNPKSFFVDIDQKPKTGLTGYLNKRICPGEDPKETIQRQHQEDPT